MLGSNVNDELTLLKHSLYKFVIKINLSIEWPC